MRIDEDVMHCVCYVGFRRNGKPVIGGTAFFVEFEESSALVVTARHIISMIRGLDASSPVVLWVGSSSGGISEVKTDPSDWLTHPDESVDAAVLRRPVPYRDLGHRCLTRRMFVTDEFIQKYDVGAGDELYFPGLFVRHRGERRIEPILRQGTVAAMPLDPVNTGLGPASVYLAEVRSMGGFSGSPVFVHMDMWRVTPRISDDVIDELGEAPAQDSFFGLVHGHYDVKAMMDGGPLDLQDVNMGIAVITPAQRVRELIELPELEEMRMNGDKKDLAEAVPTMDFAVDSTIESTANLMGKLLQVPKDEADEIHRDHQ